MQNHIYRAGADGDYSSQSRAAYLSHQLEAEVWVTGQSVRLLVCRFEALKQSQAATTQELIHRGEVLSRQLAELEANYSQIAKQNQEEVAKNHKLESEVQVLNSQLKELKEKPSVPANYQ